MIPLDSGMLYTRTFCHGLVGAVSIGIRILVTLIYAVLCCARCDLSIVGVRRLGGAK